jgi:hypothetical protein
MQNSSGGSHDRNYSSYFTLSSMFVKYRTNLNTVYSVAAVKTGQVENGGKRRTAYGTTISIRDAVRA